MDDSNAPIVVGAKQTSKAITFVIEIAEPAPACLLANSVNGKSVAETARKIIESVTS